jgi:sporulation protein YlmC with PRC-barrel domain
MEIEFGSRVLDKNEKLLGTVDHIVRDTWSGEISKFMVRREAPEKDLFISIKDAVDISKDTIILGVSLEELNTNP